MDSSVSMAISYYNEKCSVWEPFLEPVDSGKKSAPWTVAVEVIYYIAHSLNVASLSLFSHGRVMQQKTLQALNAAIDLTEYLRLILVIVEPL